MNLQELKNNIDTIANLCFQYGVDWHHVDASWGGPIAISHQSHYASGLNRADSVTVDTHKEFKSVLSNGILVTKHIGLLKSAPASTNFNSL